MILKHELTWEFAGLWDAEPYVAFLPIGLTFIIPLRNSIKVPLAVIKGDLDLNGSTDMPYRLMGMSMSAM